MRLPNQCGSIGIFSPLNSCNSSGGANPFVLWGWAFTKPELFHWSHKSKASSYLKNLIKKIFLICTVSILSISEVKWVKAGLDFRLILHILGKHFLCLPNWAGFTPSCIALAFRYTCPFVEKFSIDIETYYKTDPGEHANVFNLSPAEKRQTILGE